jgi:hypothetical protein
MALKKLANLKILQIRMSPSMLLLLGIKKNTAPSKIKKVSTQFHLSMKYTSGPMATNLMINYTQKIQMKIVSKI